MRDGWQTKTLNDLCEIARGGSPRPIKAYLTKRPDGVNWIKISDATASSKFIYVTKEKIRPEGVKRSRHVKPGDFLLSNSMSFGRPYIMATDGCIHDGWLVLSDKSGLFDRDYLYHFLSSPAAFEQFDQRAIGSTVRNLNIDLVRSVEIPLPPLPEQKRIVAILDEAFEGIGRAVANAEKNLANARELFESYLNAALAPDGKLWTTSKLGPHINLLTGFPFKSKRYTGDPSGVRLLRGDNIVQKELRWDGVKRWPSDDTDEYSRYWLQADDIVIAMDRTWIKAGTKFAVIAEADLPCLLVQRVARLRCRDTINHRFLYHLIGSSNFTEYVLSIQTGTGVPHISGKQIQDFEIPLPPIHTQVRTARLLDDLADKQSQLVANYEEKLGSLAKLKQSILQQAFVGELTRQPDRALAMAGA